MRTLESILIAFVFGVIATAQDISTVQRYEDVDAYQIYSLLLPHEESYGFAKDVLLINEVTMDAGGIPRGCLTPEAATQFSDAIAVFNRQGWKRFRLQQRFQIARPYKLYGPKTIFDRPEQLSAPSVTVSVVGFNSAKTKAVVFISSTCGGLCGSARYHLLQKIRGKWTEVSGVTCTSDS